MILRGILVGLYRIFIFRLLLFLFLLVVLFSGFPYRREGLKRYFYWNRLAGYEGTRLWSYHKGDYQSLRVGIEVLQVLSY